MLGNNDMICVGRNAEGRDEGTTNGFCDQRWEGFKDDYNEATNDE
jgi:hypothetical protein